MGMKETIEGLEKKLSEASSENGELKVTIAEYEKLHDREVPKKLLDDHKAALEEKDTQIDDGKPALIKANEANDALQQQLDDSNQYLDGLKAQAGDESNEAENGLPILALDEDIDQKEYLEKHGVDFKIIEDMTGVVMWPDQTLSRIQVLGKDIGGFSSPGVIVFVKMDGVISQQVHQNVRMKMNTEDGRNSYELVSV